MRGFIQVHIGLWLILHANAGDVTGLVARRRMSGASWAMITVVLVLPSPQCVVGAAFLSIQKDRMLGAPSNSTYRRVMAVG